MKIHKTTVVNATYSENDIKNLIISDLAFQGIEVELKDIKVSISGGYADDTWKQYSGGFSPSQPEIVPVKFNGFNVSKEI